MLYLAYQLQSDIMTPVRAWASLAANAGGPPLLNGHAAMRNLTAVYELISRAGLTHTRPSFGIGSGTVGNREVEVREEAALTTPLAHSCISRRTSPRCSRASFWWRRCRGISPLCCGRR